MIRTYYGNYRQRRLDQCTRANGCDQWPSVRMECVPSSLTWSLKCLRMIHQYQKIKIYYNPCSISKFVLQARSLLPRTGFTLVIVKWQSSVRKHRWYKLTRASQLPNMLLHLGALAGHIQPVSPRGFLRAEQHSAQTHHMPQAWSLKRGAVHSTQTFANSLSSV